MTLPVLPQDQINKAKSLRSLVATLEFALEILQTLPENLHETEETKLKINEAHIACCRLNLENNIYSDPEYLLDQEPQSMRA